MSKKENAVNENLELTIDRLDKSSISINLEQLKSVRGSDSRGYATYNLLLDGDTVAIKGSENPDKAGDFADCPLQLLVSDSFKKSKGTGKSGKRVL